MVFKQKRLEKAYFIVKMSGTAMVRLASSDLESALSHLRSWSSVEAMCHFLGVL